MSRIVFTKLHPLPAYEGPPVYRARFPWAGAVDCYVRRRGNVWETAPIRLNGVAYAHFAAVAGASLTRHAAVMAFDYYHNRKEA